MPLCPKFASWSQLIHWHLARHAGFEIEDLYKLIYQSTLGADHLLTDPQKAHENLQAEWQSQPPTRDEWLIEPLSLDATLVRLNLRPCKALGWSSEDIWRLFQASAQHSGGNKKNFIDLWRHIITDPSLPWETSSRKRFDRIMCARDYPACHHSRSYCRHNRPSYRLVQIKDIKKMFNNNT